MKIAMDVGFSAIKALNNDGKRVIFPSVIGTPQPKSTYSIGAENGLAIRLNGAEKFVPVGETALLHSQYATPRRDSAWVLDKEWRTLFATGLSELQDTPFQEVKVVLGLPVYDWNRYHEQLAESITGRLTFCRRGRDPQVANITDVKVITQPYGSLLNMALDDNGDGVGNVWSNETVAVVDLGGNTMNLLGCSALGEIAHQTTSTEFGLLKALDNVRQRIRDAFPRFNPSTHEVSEWLAAGSFSYKGQPVPIWEYAQDDLESLIEAVTTAINNNWPESARLDATFLTGGGSAAIGRYVKARLTDFAQVEIAPNPRWCNVEGYLKFAKRVFK